MLLQNLQDINQLADPHKSDEHIALTSTYFDESTQDNYELIVELIAYKSEREEPGTYHSDRGDVEGHGFYNVITSIEIQQIYIFMNFEDEPQFKITNQEAVEAIKF